MVGDGGAGEGGDYSHNLDVPNLVIQRPATWSVLTTSPGQSVRQCPHGQVSGAEVNFPFTTSGQSLGVDFSNLGNFSFEGNKYSYRGVLFGCHR